MRSSVSDLYDYKGLVVFFLSTTSESHLGSSHYPISPHHTHQRQLFLGNFLEINHQFIFYRHLHVRYLEYVPGMYLLLYIICLRKFEKTNTRVSLLVFTSVFYSCPLFLQLSMIFASYRIQSMWHLGFTAVCHSRGERST